MVETRVTDQVSFLGRLIDIKLVARGIQKKALANACGISVNTLNNAIRGENTNVRTLLAIFDKLGLNIAGIGAELDAQFSLEVPDPEESRVLWNRTKEVNTVAVAESTKTDGSSTDQTAWRMGDTPETVERIVQSR